MNVEISFTGTNKIQRVGRFALKAVGTDILDCCGPLAAVGDVINLGGDF